MARVGTAAEVAGCCLFLASGLSGYVAWQQKRHEPPQHIH
jgi:uncharacterized iron-regulated membrane protein